MAQLWCCGSAGFAVCFACCVRRRDGDWNGRSRGIGDGFEECWWWRNAREELNLHAHWEDEDFGLLGGQFLFLSDLFSLR